MNNDFLVKIMTMLETKGIKDDYEKIKALEDHCGMKF